MTTATDMKRLTRLSAILLQLQTKRILSSTILADRFQVSIRTIYRDIRVLEQIGVPIISIEGKGYSLADGYKIPPVMFNEAEANALITAGQLIAASRDSSLIRYYTDAVDKIKAVLNYTAKEKAALLSDRIAVSPVAITQTSSDTLSTIQQALTSFTVLHITYQAEDPRKNTERSIEPFAFYYSLEQNWTLIAFCRLRNDFRMFRLDRIGTIVSTGLTFPPHQPTLQQYLREKVKNFTTPDKPLS